MPQITLYVDADTAQKLKREARRAGLSRSRFVSELIRRGARTEWPQAVRDLAGAWADLETARRLRRNSGRDVRRERF